MKHIAVIAGLVAATILAAILSLAAIGLLGMAGLWPSW